MLRRTAKARLVLVALNENGALILQWTLPRRTLHTPKYTFYPPFRTLACQSLAGRVGAGAMGEDDDASVAVGVDWLSCWIRRDCMGWRIMEKSMAAGVCELDALADLSRPGVFCSCCGKFCS